MDKYRHLSLFVLHIPITKRCTYMYIKYKWNIVKLNLLISTLILRLMDEAVQRIVVAEKVW